jgi:hypothetical protein
MDANLAMWAALTGFFLPLVAAFLLQTGWSEAVRAVLTLVVCLAVAVIEVYLSGKLVPLDWANLATTILLIFTVATNTYKRFWLKVGLDRFAEATSLVKRGESMMPDEYVGWPGNT